MKRKIWISLAALALGGCNWWYNEVPSPDDFMKIVPWFDHMVIAKSVNPYSRADVPRYTPPHTVPVGGGEADWSPAKENMMHNGFDTVVARKLVRGTVVARPDSRSGEEVYNTYCAVCHASNGAGAAFAPVKEMGAKSLIADEARGLPDGYIYSYLRYGSGNMPKYGDKIPRIDERWAVVDYVRTLQKNAPAPDAAPAKGAH